MADKQVWDFPNTATPPGSDSYYVVRFSPPVQRNSLARWIAWFAQIDRIGEKANDPGVARLKLDWWREEIQFIQDHRARHPVAIALSHEQLKDWQLKHMLHVLNAIEQRILKQQPEDLEDFHRQCTEQGGSRAILLSNSREPATQVMANRIGSYIASIKRLQMLGRDVRNDYMGFPRDLLHKYSLNSTQLETVEALPELAKFSESLVDHQEQALRKDLADMRQNSLLHAPLRQAAQSYHLSRLMRRHQFDCNRKCYNLSPLHLLWSAWRMR